MLNIAFLLATTGLPLPVLITWVSGLAALTALAVTLGCLPKAPETVRPLILSPLSLPALSEPPPHAAVRSSRAARSRASRRRTTRTPRVWVGRTGRATITGLPVHVV